MRLLLSAVEPSADRLGAELLRALRPLLPDLQVEGLGGPLLRAEGLVPLPGSVPSEPTMGLVEVLRHLGSIRQNARAFQAAFVRRPDRVLCIDAPDFHLPLARIARAQGLHTVGWVAPQVWAWRPKRAVKVAAAYQQLLCLFDFEPDLFRPYGLDARFIGHPVRDRLPLRRPLARSLAIVPGSRKSELQRMLPDFLAVARVWEGPVLLPVAVGLDPEIFGVLPSHVQLCSSEEMLATAERALSKSGTVSLELALAGIPTVVAHRVHPLTYALGRLLVRGIKHIALPNILLGREAMPEFVQHFNPDLLLKTLKSTEAPPLQDLWSKVGDQGVAARAAAVLLGA